MTKLKTINWKFQRRMLKHKLTIVKKSCCEMEKVGVYNGVDKVSAENKKDGT